MTAAGFAKCEGVLCQKLPALDRLVIDRWPVITGNRFEETEMRRVLKQRSKTRGASGFGGGIECPVASENSSRLDEVTALLARIDEMNS